MSFAKYTQHAHITTTTIKKQKLPSPQEALFFFQILKISLRNKLCKIWAILNEIVGNRGGNAVWKSQKLSSSFSFLNMSIDFNTAFLITSQDKLPFYYLLSDKMHMYLLIPKLQVSLGHHGLEAINYKRI